ncbi:MAG: hypothetical protein H6510_13445 [Acidobacteria bacterium]|nr:hypothetical protein [Acidobacteriota bacterium]MCB9398811.1 hypothetical protein [Acidobacteriota bacterium]
MSTCNRWQEWLDGVGLDQKDWSLHLAACEECRAHWEFHQRLFFWQGDPMPSEADFTRMRQFVVRQIKPKARPMNYWMVAVGLAACLTGFVVGSFWQKPDKRMPESYSDLRILEQKEGLVRIGFLANEYRETTRPLNDPHIQLILAQSLLNTKSMARRLALLEETQEYMDPEIKSALLHVARYDPEMVVRSKAMDRLMKLPRDRELTQAFIEILRDDTQVHLRLKAMEYLQNQAGEEPLFDQVLRDLQSDPEPAIRVQAQQLPLETY